MFFYSINEKMITNWIYSIFAIVSVGVSTWWLGQTPIGRFIAYMLPAPQHVEISPGCLCPQLPWQWLIFMTVGCELVWKAIYKTVKHFISNQAVTLPILHQELESLLGNITQKAPS